MSGLPLASRAEDEYVRRCGKIGLARRNFYECYGEISGADWAKQVGVKWRLASEYSTWIDGEISYDCVQYVTTENEANQKELWNDLKDRLD